MFTSAVGFGEHHFLGVDNNNNNKNVQKNMSKLSGVQTFFVTL
jgi:hypothetical protein